MRLSPHVETLAAALAALPGVVAVVLGGSRASGTHRPDSDWDLGVYYRRAAPLDPADIRRLGHAGAVSELGEWGPVMNGGAWLTIEGEAVDLIFRELDLVERWLEDARAGRFEILPQSGYLAGAPTYMTAGELALSVPLRGEDLPSPDFPAELAATAPFRWQGRAALALMFARAHERDGVARTGMLALAVLCAAHARLAAGREWALNEKRLAERAGLAAAHPLVQAGDVDGVAALLGIEPLRPR